MWQSLRERIGAQAFFIPIVLVFVVLIGIPFGESVYYSFTDWSGLNPEIHFVGLDNYRRVLTDSSLLSGLVFTITFTLATTAVITILAIPLAVLLNQRFVGRRLVRAIFFFPAIPSVAILGLVWNFILSPLGSGALNTVLHSLFSMAPVPWLSDSSLAQLSVIVVAIWTSTGWHAILYLAYLQSIPADYYEAAALDGASTRQRFFNITLPLLMPAATISTLLLMVGGLNVYALPQTLTNGGPGFATHTITGTIIISGIGQAEYGQASALGVVFMLAVGAIAVLQLKIAPRLGRSV
ncbi:sugar ABC transporter permease [Nonomuraea sp. NPDC026600]|uniref:carbohydrate ABC transporter permease n=1 Tax=Nonomuraea sp. NPDC026600 TaxID=3155363 RepID=UPI0033E89CEF